MPKTPLLWLLLLIALPLQAEVQLSVSTDRPLQGQPFELLIEVAQSRSNAGGPELGPLREHFQILSNRSNYLTEKRNGKTLFISRWNLMLSARRSGPVTIPALKIKDEWSEPLQLEVQPKPAARRPALRLHTELELERAYPGAPIPFKVQLFYTVNLSHAELTQPKIEGAHIAPLGEQRSFTQQVGPQTYQVVEQRYLVQALQPGEYQIPPLTFQGSDSQGQPLNSRSQPLNFSILPYPGETMPPDLVATEVQLQQEWPEPLEQLQAGDTVTRTLIITAHGVPAQWLPDISLPEDSGISVYPQPAQLEQQWINGTLVSRKRVDYKLLLTRAGDLELSPVQLRWWDSVRDRIELAELPPGRLRVAAFNLQQQSASGQPNPRPKQQTGNPEPGNVLPWQAWLWATIALVCALGWAFSHQRNQRLRRQLTAAETIKRPAPEDPKEARAAEQQRSFAELSQACHLNDPELAYSRVLDWARAQWPVQQVDTLEDIETLAKDPTLGYLLKNLDHQRRDPSEGWHGDLLLERIIRVRQQSRQTSPTSTPVKVTIDD